MTYTQAINLYKSHAAMAAALGCTVQNITHWKKHGIPPLRQFQIEMLSGGKLKRDAELRK